MAEPDPDKTVYFQEGKYHVVATTPVRKGLPYIVCDCPKCGQTIYQFYASASGLTYAPCFGPGILFVGCRSCGRHSEMQTSDFYFKDADIEIPAPYPEKVEPLDMSRQPLLPKYRDAAPAFDINAIQDRPKAAVLIARVISLSSEIDAATAFLLKTMLKADAPAAIALFLSLRQSRMQRDALDAVARTVLDERGYELFSALMTSKFSFDKERDALAHGRFGQTPAIPDGIAWVDSIHFQEYTMRVSTMSDEEKNSWLRERTFVYELGNLERIIRDGEAVHNSINWFPSYLIEENAEKLEALYLRLSSEPHTQQALFQLREGKRKRTEFQ